MMRVGIFLYALVVALMVGASSWLGEREIVFPEVAAIAAGYFLVGDSLWREKPVKLIALIVVCAVVGLLISVLLPAPLELRLVMAYCAAHAVLILTRSSFAPMISASVLPVLIGSEGWVYPVAAFVLTAVCVVLRIFGERLRWFPVAEEGVTCGARWGGFPRMVVRAVVVAMLCLVSARSGWLFMAAPPLLVAFTQMSEPGSPLVKRPVVVVAVIVLSALAGTLCRELTVALGVPVLLTGGLAALASAGLFRLFRAFVPPAAALAVVPFLLPEDILLLYPVMIALGAIGLTLASRVLQELSASCD